MDSFQLQRQPKLKRPGAGNGARTEQVKEITRYLIEEEPEASAWMTKLSRRKRFQKRFFQLKGPFLMYWHQKINAQQFATPDCVFDLRCASECSRGDDHRTIHLPFGSRGDAGEVVLKSAAEGNDIDAAEEWLEEWINALGKAVVQHSRSLVEDYDAY